MLRIHLSGLISMEGEDVVVRARDLPGQEGRAAFAFMVGHRDAPVARGDLAEALRVYERCRALISDELGVPPSPETRALHTQLLRSL